MLTGRPAPPEQYRPPAGEDAASNSRHPRRLSPSEPPRTLTAAPLPALPHLSAIEADRVPFLGLSSPKAYSFHF